MSGMNIRAIDEKPSIVFIKMSGMNIRAIDENHQLLSLKCLV
jgi:hypothetical protein